MEIVCISAKVNRPKGREMRVFIKVFIMIVALLSFSGCISASVDIGNSGNKNQQMMPMGNPYFYPPPYYY